MTQLTDGPRRVGYFRDELTNMLRTLAVTQQAGQVAPEYRAGYLSALSHVAGLLGLETPVNFVVATIEVTL